MNQAVTGGDELGALLDDGASRSLICGVNDKGKVFWAHEGGTVVLDKGEAFGEPLGWFEKAGKIACLPMSQSTG